MYMHNWYHSNISGIPYVHGHRLQCTTIHGAFTLLLPPLAGSPLSPLCSPFDPFLLTWNPPSCDRTRPPRSQVACKLTSLTQPFTQTLPPPNSQKPNCPRLTKMTSGIIRRLLSGTITFDISRWLSYTLLAIPSGCPITFKSIPTNY
jgi:hypothetical protein